jgi:acyl carrier protein phosphodiesterase
MLDVTWETPEGDIVPLDGFLDPYFQEVYLEAESIPLFTKLVKHVSPDALQDYVEQLTGQVATYSQREPKNFGKAAKRMYNIFRLTGRYGEAAYIRELFDEPAALLYQVGALIDTIDEAMENEVDMDYDPLVDQVDSLILSVVRVASRSGRGPRGHTE